MISDIGSVAEIPRLMKRHSMRAAINRKCKECIYDPIGGNGTWRQQVADCTATNCPLFELRPMPESSKKKRKGENT